MVGGQLEIQESPPAPRVSGQGGAGVGAEDYRELPSDCVRRRGQEPGGEARRRGGGKSFPAAGRGLRRELQGIQCQQY